MTRPDRIWADTWLGFISGQLFGLMDLWHAAWIVWGLTGMALLGGLAAMWRNRG
jgi:hypothetical protein